MKFFLLLVLSFAIFGFSAAQVYGYSPIQFDPNNNILVGYLNYGIAQATEAAQSNGQLAGDWYWTYVLDLETKFVSGINYYAFSVDIANLGRDTATIMVVVTVAADGTESLKSYAIM